MPNKATEQLENPGAMDGSTSIKPHIYSRNDNLNASRPPVTWESSFYDEQGASPKFPLRAYFVTAYNKMKALLKQKSPRSEIVGSSSTCFERFL